MELDPSQFLAQGSSDESENEQDDGRIKTKTSQNGNDGPSILTSLGLTHINSVPNPFASYAVSITNSFYCLYTFKTHISTYILEFG